MAKKIRVDFSKTEERSGWNTKRVPEGIYAAKVVSVQETEAGDSTPMLVYGFQLEDRRYRSRLFPFYCKLQPNQMWKLRDLFVAGGESVPKGKGQLDAEKPVGKVVAVEIADDDYNGNERSSIDGVFGTDILDDEPVPGNDDEDEEGDEPDEDEVDEDEDEDEADEPDFESMSIAELRKLAKAAGIDTAGLKKAELIEALEEGDEEDEEDEEDDDLDEDDLEDDDFDDDEDDDFDEEEDEEEEPAPKKRKAAPAKAAPAAKRTVKRRR